MCRVLTLLTESLPAPAALVTSAHLVSAFGVALAANYGQVGRRHVIVKHLLRTAGERAAVLAAEHALALLVFGQVSLKCLQMVCVEIALLAQEIPLSIGLERLGLT